MALSKSGVNIFFACIVAALALTAATFIYVKSNEQAAQPPASQETPGNALPANHPPIDTAQRVAALEKMIAADPRNPEYPTQVGNLYYDAGQYEKAIGYYQKSLDLKPRDPNVETDLAACLHYIGQDDRALETLDKVLKYSPGFAQAMYNKGVILVSGKKSIESGIKVWEDLLRSNPNYPQRAELEQKINQLKSEIR
jgi:tetratricopeptide (TPR) repeat protein